MILLWSLVSSKGKELINRYKVMVSKVTSEHAGEPDKSGMVTVLSTIAVLKPKEVCTDSYLIAFSSDNITEVDNFSKMLIIVI